MWIWRTSAERKKHVKGMLRVGAYFGAMALVFGAVQVKSARAELRNRTVELGRQMYQLANASQHDVSKVTMNGQAMYIGSSLTKDDSRTVLDRYESYCQKNSAQPVEEWRTLGDKTADNNEVNNKQFLSTGTMRGGDDEEGAVICFTKTASSKPTIKAAIESFGETGDLGAFGSVRYAYVRKGNSGKTVILTAWTDEKFLASEIFVEGRDSQGTDIADIPRPPTSRRVIAAQVEGTPFAVNMYESGDKPDKIISFYDGEMQKQGWVGLDPELEKFSDEKPDPKHPPAMRLYIKDMMVLTVVAKGQEDGKTMTGLGMAGTSAPDAHTPITSVPQSND